MGRGLLHTECEVQMLGRGFRRQAEHREGWPHGVHVATQVGFRIWGEIRGDHSEPARQIERHPTRTDDSGADNRYPTYGFVHSHASCSLGAPGLHERTTLSLLSLPSWRSARLGRPSCRGVLLP